jgi:hypothetical protein
MNAKVWKSAQCFLNKDQLNDIECADRLISKMEILIHEVVAWKREVMVMK